MMQAETGMEAWGSFILRSGVCPVCSTPFDDEMQAPRGDERYCPKCKRFRVGEIKQEGELKPKEGHHGSTV